MRKVSVLGVLFILALLLSATFVPVDAQATTNDKACWGQATKVFAQMGRMGEHASQQETPRMGLHNLARALYAEGVISAPTMQALGAFVAEAEGLSIDACME